MEDERRVPVAFTNGADRTNAAKAWLDGFDTAQTLRRLFTIEVDAAPQQRVQQETVSEALCHGISSLVDRTTLDAGLSRGEAARTYREIAEECRDRAACLDKEAADEE